MLINIVRDERYGRGWYAAQPIKPGTEVLREEPQVHVISRSQRGKRCDWCLRNAEHLKRCTRCLCAWYCGHRCQKNDWIQHKAECRGIAAIQPRMPTDKARFIARAVARESEIANLIEGKASPDTKQLIEDQVLEAMELLGVAYKPSAYDAACKIKCNAFDIYNHSSTTIGEGIYKSCTMMNHSCEPNCAWSFDGKAMVIHAVTDISADEQLFISYIALVESCSHRRACLLDHYAFECTCVRCRREEGNDGEVERNMATIKANEQLYNTQIENNDKAGAMETAFTLVALYRCSLFAHHPAQGLALFRLGKLQKQAALQQEKSGATLTAAIGSLTTAVQALQICFGTDHPLTKEAVLELQEAEEEHSIDTIYS
ncbi:hypothetical protein EMCRGX_G013245 [Ephydatia muelleri]